MSGFWVWIGIEVFMVEKKAAATGMNPPLPLPRGYFVSWGQKPDFFGLDFGHYLGVCSVWAAVRVKEVGFGSLTIGCFI
jgi:hypothetical protein